MSTGTPVVAVPPMDRRRIEARTLAIVGAFVAELGTAPGHGAVALGDALDRDLGLGSLERVELLFRLEQAFGVRFADDVAGGAETPADLVRAVLAGGPAIVEPLPEPVTLAGPGIPAPASARTLVEVLACHAAADPERTHIVLRTDEGEERPITYGALWRRTASMAAALAERGVRRGDRVAIMLRTEEAFFPAFFAVLLAGAVPVPIYPPFRPDRIEEYAIRQAGILDNAGARLLLTFGQAVRVADLLRRRVPSLAAVATVERLAPPEDLAAPPVADALDAEAPALIQYTSGSTGDPKGVLLTHANLLANIRAIGQAVGIRPDDVAVSWLPLYHDMGLIGVWLGALYHAVPVVIFSPLAFLARPARWLWALHAHRGTISPAPNFAFDLCVKRVTDEEIRGLDLSAWRLALNGSEPVSPETIERFTRRFAPYGFRPEAMGAAYGLAESAVALSIAPPGRPPRVDRVARAVFERTRVAVPAAPQAPALAFVSCGVPLADHEVRVVDAAGNPVGERVEGRIEFRGPSVMRAYFRNPAATRAAVRDGWVDSGDLGYWAEGELFVTGRRKDVIIKAGRNLYPQEIEELVGGVPGIRRGCVAAFGVPDPAIGTERLVVVAESRERAPAALERLRAAVIECVVAALGIPPDTLVIAAPGAVLKTPSGKIRRSATREALARGALGRRPSARVQYARLLVADLRARVSRLGAGAVALGRSARALAVLAVAFPLLGALLALAPRRAVDPLVRRWCRAVLAACGCRLTVEGLEHLPVAGPFVLAANHASYVDTPVLLAGIPAPFRFVAKRELLRTPLVGTIIRKVGHLTVERVDVSRSVADAERVGDALRAGASLLFFPEGTFRRAPALLPFKLGAFKAAVDAGRPIVPVAIRGTREVLPADTWVPRPGPIAIVIRPPIAPEGRDWRAIVRLRDRVRAAIEAALSPS